MSNLTIVNIPTELSDWIEKLFFEYNARLNVFKFLIKDNDIEQNILDKYQKEIENKYTELELAKKQVSEQFKPYDFNNSYIYNFNFDENTIIYEELKN